jgi:hypothetical protein
MYFRFQTRILLPVVLFLFPALQIIAQSSTEDSTSFSKARNNATALYYQSSGDQSRLYNGTYYAGYPFVFAEGNPFFLTDKEQQGSVVYDNILYQDINLLYDELTGVLIMQDENHRIQLLNDRISGFTILNYRFTHIINDNHDNSPATGFYNILYEGSLGILKKEIKTIREISTYSEGKMRMIDMKTNYYIRKNNDYFIIKDKKDLLNFFGERKKEIQHFIKAGKLNFKKDPDILLAKVASYYDQLIK